MRVLAAELLAVLASLLFSEINGLNSVLVKNCGRTRHPSRVRRVVGGRDAERLANPWMVLVIGKDDNFCGGSLITSLFVLTSASCASLSPKQVRLGEHNRTCMSGDCLSSRLIVNIDQQFRHPQYTGDQDAKNDIALLQLATPVVYSDYIRPICLSVDMPSQGLPRTFNASGWGRTAYESESPVLQATTLHLQDPDHCNRRFDVQLDDSQLCVGTSHSDTCNGDSGGPLSARTNYWTGSKNVHRVFQFGIVSYGSSSCKSVAIYTNVYYYTNWIVDTIKNVTTHRRE
ncbi:melanization protease 1-like [Drosophila biarmipes]|uniref:melanization protease 1-like n=1 Tax=Drosophila biarmipes TaxID=125945 RepID=UPI001CDAC0EB|nr:melanization protease 1-like [Drosophila biarmipes]